MRAYGERVFEEAVEVGVVADAEAHGVAAEALVPGCSKGESEAREDCGVQRERRGLAGLLVLVDVGGEARRRSGGVAAGCAAAGATRRPVLELHLLAPGNRETAVEREASPAELKGGGAADEAEVEVVPRFVAVLVEKAELGE